MGTAARQRSRADLRCLQPPSFRRQSAGGFARPVRHDGRISAHYLDVLAIQPAIGRNFSGTKTVPMDPGPSILSYGLWRNIFGC